MFQNRNVCIHSYTVFTYNVVQSNYFHGLDVEKITSNSHRVLRTVNEL
jgi:hypothetical protein